MSGNSLFVQEEEDEIKPQVDVEGDIDMIQEQETNGDKATEEVKKEVKHTLHLVKEEEEEEEIDEEDPIVESYPMFMAGKEENLHVLQLVNKAKLVAKKSAEHPIVAAARYKKKSNLWELDFPIDEEAFFNKHKAEDKWDGVAVQTLKGVGVYNEGQYAAFVKDKQLYLTPVKYVSQLRPYFNYIDSSIQQTRKEESKQNQNPASQKAQMVTMSVKSVNDPSQNRLTGALLAHKVADEEDPKKLQWVEGTVEQFQETIIKESYEHILKPIDSEDSYDSKLFA